MSSQNSDTNVKTLTVSERDITSILAIINVAAQRGCFKPIEFKPVGELFDKFTELVSELRTNDE